MKKLTKKAIDGIIKKNEGVLVRDFVAVQDELAWKYMIESGRIFDKSMHDLFYGKSVEDIQDVMSRLDHINLWQFHDRDQKFKDNMKAWLTSFQEHTMLSNYRKVFHVVLPKQLLALHYLLKMFDKNFDDIHGDKTVQAKLLSIIFGKSEDNIRKALSKYLHPDTSKEFYKEHHTNSIVDIFNDLGRKDLVEEIKKTTEDIKSKNLG